MSELIISVSGLRGVYGQALTLEAAARYAEAFAALAPPGVIVIGRDGRASGPELCEAILDALTRVGRTCIDAGVAATPTIGVLVRHYQAAGGLQISASHNPAEYNGIKLFSPEGRVLSSADGEEVRLRYLATADSEPFATSADAGSVESCDDSIGPHLELVLDTVDVPAIRARGFRVLLDSNRGAGSRLGVPLLEALGCQVTILGGKPDGAFEHTPEPTVENLQSVLGEVPRAKATVGFCQDPDADRLAIIDEHGRYLGEEYTLALCVDHILRSEPAAVVTNCSTSRMSEDLATKYKVPFARSAVGEANVVEQMEAYDAVIGGEGNGGVIDPRVGYVRDSFVGMALVLEAMAKRQLPVSQLADELPRYAMVKTKTALAPEQVGPGLLRLARHFDAAEADWMDGLRLDWSDRWLLVRASNTEPIVRFVAEAPTEDVAQALCREAADVLSERK